MKNIGKIRIFSTEFEWREELIRHIYAVIDGAVKSKGRAVVALSGGSTPIPIYEKLALDVRRDPIRADLMQLVDFVMVDERLVPSTHPDSNGGRVKTIWQGLPFKLHLLDETLEPSKAALVYENKIKELLKFHGGLDLVMLGMGVDGHTASLFPGSKGLKEQSRLFILNVNTDGVMRYSLSFRALREAYNRTVLFSGNEKLLILNEMLQSNDSRFPIESLMFDQGSELNWYCLLKND